MNRAVDTPVRSSSRPDTCVLLRRAQRGDADCLEEVVTRYYPRVLVMVQRRLGPFLRSTTSHEDMTQECFLHVLTSLPRFHVRSRAGLMRWLARIVETTIRGWYDYVVALKRPRFEQGVERVEVDGSPSVPDQVAMKEDAAWADRAFRCLTSVERRIVDLRRFTTCSWQEIADRTGKPSAGAARAAYRAAMERLSRSRSVAGRRSG